MTRINAFLEGILTDDREFPVEHGHYPMRLYSTDDLKYAKLIASRAYVRSLGAAHGARHQLLTVIAPLDLGWFQPRSLPAAGETVLESGVGQFHRVPRQSRNDAVEEVILGPFSGMRLGWRPPRASSSLSRLTDCRRACRRCPCRSDQDGRYVLMPLARATELVPLYAWGQQP